MRASELSSAGPSGSAWPEFRTKVAASAAVRAMTRASAAAGAAAALCAGCGPSSPKRSISVRTVAAAWLTVAVVMVLLASAARSAAGVKYLVAVRPAAGISPSSPESRDSVPGLAPGPASTKPVKPSSLRRIWMSRPGLPHGDLLTGSVARGEPAEPGPVAAPGLPAVPGAPGAAEAEPAGTVAEPPGAVAEPAGTVAEPAGAAGAPAGTVAEPAGTVAEPPGAMAEPAATVAVPAGPAGAVAWPA